MWGILDGIQSVLEVSGDVPPDRTPNTDEHGSGIGDTVQERQAAAFVFIRQRTPDRIKKSDKPIFQGLPLIFINLHSWQEIL